MTCRDFADFLMDYLDGQLSRPVREDFDRHLAECPDCIAYMSTYKETVRLGKSVCTEEHDSFVHQVPEELVQAILAARARENS